MVDVPGISEIKVKTLAIVVENDKYPFEVVTWMPLRSINEGFEKGEEIYDARMVALSKRVEKLLMGMKGAKISCQLKFR